MANVKDIEGIGPVLGEKLVAAGVATLDSLLETAASAKGRTDLAGKTGISESKILEWVNRADLARIKGIGSEYADLLEAAGVDTVVELAQRNSANLYTKVVEVNSTKNLVRALPTEQAISDWIDQAKSLDRVVTH